MILILYEATSSWILFLKLLRPWLINYEKNEWKKQHPPTPQKRIFSWSCFLFFKWDVPVSENAKPKCKL